MLISNVVTVVAALGVPIWLVAEEILHRVRASAAAEGAAETRSPAKRSGVAHPKPA
jgi:hypothetical protein